MSFVYYLSPASCGNATTTGELHEECAKKIGSNPKDLQLFKARPINWESKSSISGRVGIQPEDNNECYQALIEQNQHLTETLDRTVEALLTLQGQQTTYHSTKIELQAELDELQGQIQSLQQDLNIQENKAQQWKQTFEAARIS